MYVGGNYQLLRALTDIALESTADDKQFVDQTFMHPIMKFKKVYEPDRELDYKLYKFQVAAGRINIVLYFFLDIKYTGGAGDIYFSLPELNGTRFAAMCGDQDGGADSGHPPQQTIISTFNCWNKVFSGGTENNGNAAIKVTVSGSFQNRSAHALVAYTK